MRLTHPLSRSLSFLLLVLSACSGHGDEAGSPARPPGVPQEYARLYRTLEGNLSELALANDARPILSQPRLGGHVLAADSNLGPQLLSPSWLGGVELTLDRMRDLGFQTITLAIGYPVLLGSWSPDADAYLDFYRRTADAVRARGMGLGVEQIVVFDESVFSPLRLGVRADLGGDRARFAREHAAMAQIIIDEIEPDFLTILHEPKTFAELTAIPELGTPEGATAFLADVLAALQPGGRPVGAGLVNSDEIGFAESYCALPLDYLDIHLYATDPSSIANAYRIADVARACGRRLLLSEAWLYKSTEDDGAERPTLEGWELGFRRDVFGFFEPLDVRFHEELVRFAARAGAEVVTPFWTNYYFAYVDYDESTRDASYAELVRVLAPRLVADAIVGNQVTGLGRKYGELASSTNSSLARVDVPPNEWPLPVEKFVKDIR